MYLLQICNNLYIDAQQRSVSATMIKQRVGDLIGKDGRMIVFGPMKYLSFFCSFHETGPGNRVKRSCIFQVRFALLGNGAEKCNKTLIYKISF